MGSNIEEKKKEFLKDEFFMFSWNAAVEHNKIWLNSWKKNQKIEFKTKIKTFVEDMMNNYKCNSISEEEHLRNIEKIQEKSKIDGNKLDIGICQKLLNMMCKYYWCAGWIAEPVHLPIDRINLTTIGEYDISWTKIKSLEEYQNLISKFKSNTNDTSLAQWELCNWKRRSNK